MEVCGTVTGDGSRVGSFGNVLLGFTLLGAFDLQCSGGRGTAREFTMKSTKDMKEGLESPVKA